MFALAELRTSGPLVVLDMANNHNGSEAHARAIIESVANVASGLDLRVAIKFQYRQLDTFIHPDYSGSLDYPYISRFLGTALPMEAFERLTAFAHGLGLLTAATPFDEDSVALVEGHGHDFLKVASVSLTDWPLAERIARCALPVLASTAGASLADVDRAVSFYSRRIQDFAIMHCVAAYPTSDSLLNLNRISLLRHRYPQLAVGYSTHEDPDNLMAVGIALGQGAQILERHVGLASPTTPLNGYSSDSSQLRSWLDAVITDRTMLGPDCSENSSEAERAALFGLRRGTFLRRDVAIGDRISDDAVFFAIPLQQGQVAANDWSAYREFRASADARAGEALSWDSVTVVDRQSVVLEIADWAKSLLTQASVTSPVPADLEISHHYGIDRFDQFGCAMITLVNRVYCKKLILVKAGQEHPEQHHVVKEETFHVLHGTLRLSLDGIQRQCTSGDVITIMPGVRHSFVGVTDTVLEEISTTHLADDSFYTDASIHGNLERKTLLRFWS